MEVSANRIDDVAVSRAAEVEISEFGSNNILVPFKVLNMSDFDIQINSELPTELF